MGRRGRGHRTRKDLGEKQCMGKRGGMGEEQDNSEARAERK